MLSLFNILSSVKADDVCDVPVKIQMVQVQDTTVSFKDDIGYMKNFMNQLTGNLSEKYGPIDFGMASFTDKPQVITGYGKNEGVWRDSSFLEDYCYKRVDSLSTEVNMDRVPEPQGGKDQIENQLDSLAASVVDPNMNWVKGDTTESGDPVIKLAVLVTDAGSHRNSDLDLSDEKRNWYHEELFRGPCDYKDSKCKSDFGAASSRTGTILSLKGVLGHYNHFKLGNDTELLTHMEYYSSPHGDEIDEFRFCCTDVYYQSWPNANYSQCPNFPSFRECATASCKRCKEGECDQYCTDNPDFEADWLSAIDLPEIDIKPYVYGADRFDSAGEPVACNTMEYPDPFSQEYAQIFLDANVTPVFFLRLPGVKPNLYTQGTFAFDFDDYLLAAHVCPVAGQRLAKYNLCYFYPGARTAKGITGMTNACDNYDPSELDLDSFYSDCWTEHYGEVVDSLNSYGVNAYFSLIDSSVKQEDFLNQLEEVINDVVQESDSCHTTTTTTTTTTVATTTPATTTTTTTTEAPAPGPGPRPGPNTTTTENVDPDEDETTVAPGPGPVPNTTTTENVDPDEDETTVAPVPPVTEASDDDSTEEGSSNTAVIVGSAAGGLAVVGAAAGLWAKGMIPGMSSSGVDIPVEDADINTDVLEREQMTEVNANMFL